MIAEEKTQITVCGVLIMAEFIINGGKRLSGEVSAHGAKNSILPILAATVLCSDECIIKNCPSLSDVNISLEMLKSIGCDYVVEDDVISFSSVNADSSTLPPELTGKMRSSVIFAGALLGRMGEAVIGLPGGCNLGPRPIDMHIDAFRKLGAEVEQCSEILYCRARNGLHGANIDLSVPSVGVTENTILAAVTAKGITVIHNAAREPEICDLADFLNKCGAKILGAGCSTIIIEGKPALHGCEHSVIPDRIETATFLSAAAATGGDVIVKNSCYEHLANILPCFEKAGCEFVCDGDMIRIKAPLRLGSFGIIETSWYPGFATDAQPITAAAAAVADGESAFIENIFSDRFKYADELSKMGADISASERIAVINGTKLHGASVRATDLRGGAALIVAALSAEGTTNISDIYHIDRGYTNIEKSLSELGADIKRA